MTVELAGHELAVETFLTPSETVVRHAVQRPFIHIAAPTLRTEDGEVELIESAPWAGLIQHRYGPVGSDDSLTLVFQHIVIAESIELWAVELTLEARATPPSSPGSNELDWQVESTGEHPDVLRIEVVRRLAGDVRLILTFDGPDWRPGPTRPVVFGDDAQMDVASAGWSTPDGRIESSISIAVDNSGLPRTLAVSARDREREVTLPSTEVVIRP